MNALLRAGRIPVVLSWLIAALSACGGGGDDPAPAAPAAPTAPLTLSPSTVTVSAAQGDKVPFSTVLTLNLQVVTGDAYLGMIDPQSIADDDISLTPQSSNSARINLYTRRSLALGEHRGNLEFYVCKDSRCDQVYSETPVKLAYVITVTPAPPAGVVTPSSITGTVEAGDELSVTISFQARSGLSPQSFAASDSQGRLAPTVTYQSQAAGVYLLTLRFNPIDLPGTHSGDMSLLVCTNYFCSDDDQVSGSVTVPYTITVTPAVLLQPVPTASGLPEWDTFQGNASHTGHFPATLNPASFTHRWTWASPISGLPLSPATTGDGKVIVSASGYFSPAALFAVNESDGTTVWRHDFPSIFAVNHPATIAGRVFVATSGHSDTAMWSFDLLTGAQVFRKPFTSQWGHYLAPTFKDGFVYTNGGSYGGMYSFRASSGATRWFGTLQQYDLWTPAVDSSYAYAHTGYEFAVLDRTTGDRVFTVPNSAFNWSGYSLNTAPVIGSANSVLVVDGIYNYALPANNNLIRYDIAARNESWRVAGNFATNPVVAGGKIYLVHAANKQLQARDESTGALLWTWSPPDTTEEFRASNLVLTDNLVFLSTMTKTYAIDLATHQDVWSVPRAGALAVSSNRVLYIVSPTPGSIDAYNLF